MKILKAGVLYFALVFAAGFVLGTIRVLWVVPSFGTRVAELIEAPFMLLVTVFVARWVVRHLSLPPQPTKRLAVGLVALLLLITTEFSVVLSLRGLTIGEYFASRDPVAGAVYAAMLGVFAIMPLATGRK